MNKPLTKIEKEQLEGLVQDTIIPALYEDFPGREEDLKFISMAGKYLEQYLHKQLLKSTIQDTYI